MTTNSHHSFIQPSSTFSTPTNFSSTLPNNLTNSDVILSSTIVSDPLILSIDSFLLIEILNDILSNYCSSYEIIFQACETINIYLTINTDSTIKEYIISIIVNNFDKYQLKQDIIEMFLQTLTSILKQAKILNQQQDNTSICFYLGKIAALPKLRDGLYEMIFRIIRAALKFQTSPNSINEMFSIVRVIESRESLKGDENISLYSKLFKSVATISQMKSGKMQSKLDTRPFPTVPGFNMLLKGINKAIRFKSFTLLEDFKVIMAHFPVDGTDDEVQVLCEELILLYLTSTNTNLNTSEMFEIMKTISNNPNNTDESTNLNPLSKRGEKKDSVQSPLDSKLVCSVLEIIGFLVTHSQLAKDKLTAINLIGYIEDLLLKNKGDQVLEYQAKACIVSLKKKSKQLGGESFVNTSNSKIKRIGTLESEPVKDDIKKFLCEERKVKM